MLNQNHFIKIIKKILSEVSRVFLHTPRKLQLLICPAIFSRHVVILFLPQKWQMNAF